MHALAASGLALRTFGIGRHMFEYLESVKEEQIKLKGFCTPHMVPHGLLDRGKLWNEGTMEPFKTVFRDVRRLRLPFTLREFHRYQDQEEVRSEFQGSMLPQLLQNMSGNLTHLMLGAHNIPRGFGGVDPAVNPWHELSFDSCLGPLTFPNLEGFDFRGWRFSQKDITRFLLRHASKLRTLRLFDVDLTVGTWDSVATFGSNNLHLTGIEVSTDGPWWIETPEDYGHEAEDPENAEPIDLEPLQHKGYDYEKALHTRSLGGRENALKPERCKDQIEYDTDDDEDFGEGLQYRWRRVPRRW